MRAPNLSITSPRARFHPPLFKRTRAHPRHYLAPHAHPSRSRPSFDRSGAHFLTHAHSDHLIGLKNGWRSPTGAKIYCTAITKALILRKYPKLPGTSIVTLAPDQPTVVDLGGTGELLTVTAIDAGHCPGSVGFLFEGACGRIYHTGDFRREDWAEDPSTIPTQLCKAPLDLLLLDNTYCNPAYAFPTRAHAQSTIIDLIVHQYPEREIVVGIDSLGKEPLLAAIATATGHPVRVTKERFDAADVARDAEGADGGADTAVDVITTHDTSWEDIERNPSTTEYSSAPPAGSMAFDSRAKGRVWAFPKQRVTRDMLTARAANSGRKVCGILPTGWAATGAKGMPSVLVGEGGAGAGDDGRERGDSVEDEFFFRDGDEPAVIRAVPYSLHAPYEELESIVRSLAPVSVVGNTRPPKSPDAPAIDPENFFGRLLSDPPDDEEDDEESLDADGYDMKEDDDVAGFVEGKENNEVGHRIVDVLTSAAGTTQVGNKPASTSERPAAMKLATKGISLARSAPGYKSPSPSPAVVVDEEDDEEEDTDILPTQDDDNDDDDTQTEACSLDATLTGAESRRIREDEGVDSARTEPPNRGEMLERRNALAFARALLKGGGVSVFKKGKDGDVEGGGEKGRKRRRLPPGFLPSHNTGGVTRTRW